MTETPTNNAKQDAEALIQKYIPTSRAIQIEKSTGRAITNSNYWMQNTIDNAIGSIELVLSEYKVHLDNPVFHRAQHYREMIKHLRAKRELLMEEPHQELPT